VSLVLGNVLCGEGTGVMVSCTRLVLRARNSLQGGMPSVAVMSAPVCAGSV
jgi:hypothetical protein